LPGWLAVISAVYCLRIVYQWAPVGVPQSCRKRAVHDSSLRKSRPVRICIVVGGALLDFCGARRRAETIRQLPPMRFKPRVEALAAGRARSCRSFDGLDTRPWTYLIGQAGAAANAIGETRALQDEDGLGRCPDVVSHVRRVCATAERLHSLARLRSRRRGPAGYRGRFTRRPWRSARASSVWRTLHTFLRASD